jgi:hypothetical protein
MEEDERGPFVESFPWLKICPLPTPLKLKFSALSFFAPLVSLTPSLPLMSPAVACGHLPRAPVRSGARCLL